MLAIWVQREAIKVLCLSEKMKICNKEKKKKHAKIAKIYDKNKISDL